MVQRVGLQNRDWQLCLWAALWTWWLNSPPRAPVCASVEWRCALHHSTPFLCQRCAPLGEQSQQWMVTFKKWVWWDDGGPWFGVRNVFWHGSGLLDNIPCWVLEEGHQLWPHGEQRTPDTGEGCPLELCNVMSLGKGKTVKWRFKESVYWGRGDSWWRIFLERIFTKV